MMMLSLDSCSSHGEVSSTLTMRAMDGEEVQLVSGGNSDGGYYVDPYIAVDFSLLTSELVNAGLVDPTLLPTPWVPDPVIPPDLPPIDIQIPFIEGFIGYVGGIDAGFSWDNFLMDMYYEQLAHPYVIWMPSPIWWDEDDCY